MTQKTAVITGGAGGLGCALTRLLQVDDWHVVILDLPGPGLQAVLEQQALRPANAAGGATVLACDVTDEAQVVAICARVIELRPSIDLVIYNAGITQISPTEALRPVTHRKVFDVNYFGAASMAIGFLPAVRKSQGIHLAISSVAGFAPLYKRAAYAASKHALEGFFKTLRAEEKGFHVDVLIASPSFVGTNLNRAERQEGGIARPGSAEDGMDYMSADEAARSLLDGVINRQRRILVGRVAHLAWWLSRLSPALYERLMLRKMKQG